MRALFGLVSLLVTVAIIAYLFSIYSIPVAKEGKKQQDVARQISGHDKDGMPADRTVTLDADQHGNRIDDLIVTKVVPGGAYDRFYGFKPGDKIVAIGDADINTLSNGDFEMAKAMLLQEGYEKQKPVTVLRNGQKIELPGGTVLSAAPAPNSNASPEQPTNPSGSNSSQDAIQKQLNQIKIPGQ